MRGVIGVVVCVVVVVAGCASEIRSNLVIARPSPDCGANPDTCYQQQLTDERPGSCWEQRPGPGEQILSCADEKHSHLTPEGKTWITVGAVAGGVLVTAYIAFLVYTFISFSNAASSGY